MKKVGALLKIAPPEKKIKRKGGGAQKKPRILKMKKRGPFSVIYFFSFSFFVIFFFRVFSFWGPCPFFFHKRGQGLFFSFFVI